MILHLLHLGRKLPDGASTFLLIGLPQSMQFNFSPASFFISLFFSDMRTSPSNWYDLSIYKSCPFIETSNLYKTLWQY
jgi:hypothetical protein